MDIDLQIAGLGWILLDLTATKFAPKSKASSYLLATSLTKKSSKIIEIYGILHDSLQV